MIYHGTIDQDQIQLGPGRDEVYAYGGDDLILISSLSEPSLDFQGEIYDGGDGFDQLFLSGYGGSYDLSKAVLVSIERINLPTAMFASPTTLIMLAEQLPQVTTFEFGGWNNVLEVHMGQASSLNLSSNKFSVFFIFGSRINVIGDDSNETVFGSGGSDHIFGGGGNDALGEYVRYFSPASGYKGDFLYGGEGNDVIIDGVANDVIDGGPGIDEIVLKQDFSSTPSVRIDLSVVNAQNTGQGIDYVSNIENVRAGAGNDTITGSNIANRLDGENGSDQLFGASGNDTLIGQSGNDLLVGGLGSDQIYGGAGADRLYGQQGSDRLWGGLGSDRFIFSGAMGTGNVDVFLILVQKTIQYSWTSEFFHRFRQV